MVRGISSRFLFVLILATPWVVELHAQEVVADRPPMYARAEKARVYLSPLTLAVMRLDLGDQPDPTRDHVEGVGLSLGADFFVHRLVALWINGHVGAVTAVEQEAEGARGKLSNARGAFRSLGAGVSGVASAREVTAMAGIGLFTVAAEWEGHHLGLGRDVDTNATLTGVIASVRIDYTFRNGFFIGAGLDTGAGTVGGREAQSANDPTGDWLVLYFPLGWTY